jgi:hypothetical protein
MFYMAVRYDGADGGTTNLELVNGLPGANQMGDLAAMVGWHFTDPVDQIELRRNHLIWSSVDNPLYYQGNRNPFIDHPEFVWAIWGPAPNDSVLYLGDDIPADGSTAISLEMRALVDTATEPVVLTLNKAGATPTTYEIVADGAPQIVDSSLRLTFAPGNGAVELTIPWPPMNQAAMYSLALTIDNTDLTSAGPGVGAADGDDLISADIAVLNHSQASFDAAQDADDLLLDFGTLPSGGMPQVLGFSIHDLESGGLPAATLHIVDVQGSGDTAWLQTDVVAGTQIAGGGSQVFSASFDPAGSPGLYQAVYVIGVTDEPLPGGLAGEPLILTLLASVVEETCAGTSDCADLDGDGVRDDNCTWWACADGACLAAEIHFADMGGSNGVCPPDGAADANDRFHALNCFSNQDTTGQPGYACEDAAPVALNVDAGGPFGSCAPDGVCDGNDAFHALNAFSGSTTCACPMDGGPMPDDPARDNPPAATAVANLALVPSQHLMRPDEMLEVSVFLGDTALPDLRGYQLHLGVSGGVRGTLDLVDIWIHESSVFSAPGKARASRNAQVQPFWSAFNLQAQQILAGLDGPGIPAEAGAYLATFVYRASADAAGTFDVELLHGEGAALKQARSFLFATPAASRILIGEARAAQIRVLPRVRRP